MRIQGRLRLPECHQGSWYERVLEAMCRLRGRGLDFTNLVLRLWRAEFGMEGEKREREKL